MLNEKFCIKSLLLICLCLGLLGACATTGTKVDQNQISNIKKGVTTQQEIKEMFGKPQSVSITPDGNTSWIYQYGSMNGVNNTAVSFIPIIGPFIAPNPKFEHSNLSVFFDKNNVVTNYIYSGGEN